MIKYWNLFCCVLGLFGIVINAICMIVFKDTYTQSEKFWTLAYTLFFCLTFIVHLAKVIKDAQN